MYCMISNIMYFGGDETWRQGKKNQWLSWTGQGRGMARDAQGFLGH